MQQKEVAAAIFTFGAKWKSIQLYKPTKKINSHWVSSSLTSLQNSLSYIVAISKNNS